MSLMKEITLNQNTGKAAQLAQAVVMVRPVDFGFNEETALDNEFQQKLDDSSKVTEQALVEFERMVKRIKAAGIDVLVLEKADTDYVTPDAVFPNNWFSTSQDGTLTIYPMFAENRRQERRIDDLTDLLKREGYQVGPVEQLADMDEKLEILEGTGALVIDHKNSVLYASQSERCHEAQFKRFAEQKGYQASYLFDTASDNGKSIYHTNVMMSVGEGFAVICADCFVDEKEYAEVKASLSLANEVIEISKEQMEKHFCGNILHVKNADQDAFIIMSKSAFNGFTQVQKQQLEQYGQLLVNDIDTIEAVGGGSARCMVAEVFFDKAKP